MPDEIRHGTRNYEELSVTDPSRLGKKKIDKLLLRGVMHASFKVSFDLQEYKGN